MTQYREGDKVMYCNGFLLPEAPSRSLSRVCPWGNYFWYLSISRHSLSDYLSTGMCSGVSGVSDSPSCTDIRHQALVTSLLTPLTALRSFHFRPGSSPPLVLLGPVTGSGVTLVLSLFHQIKYSLPDTNETGSKFHQLACKQVVVIQIQCDP